MIIVKGVLYAIVGYDEFWGTGGPGRCAYYLAERGEEHIYVEEIWGICEVFDMHLNRDIDLPTWVCPD